MQNSAASPILFYALHSCGVQARLLAGATSMVEGVHIDTPEHSDELSGMACSSARLAQGLKMLREVEKAVASGSAPAHVRGSAAEHLWSSYMQNLLAQMRLDFVNPSGVARRLVDRAKERLDKAAFVGLTEHWRASICAFHKMYGGAPTAPESKKMTDALARRIWNRISSHMSAHQDALNGTGRQFSSVWSEYAQRKDAATDAAAALGVGDDVNETTRGLLRSVKGAMMVFAQQQLVDELEKLGFRDWMDEQVYKHAKQVFYAIAEKHGCSLVDPKKVNKQEGKGDGVDATLAKWRSQLAARSTSKAPAFRACATGLRSDTGSKVVCCPASCGSCDGNGCSERPGGPRHCCGLATWKGGRQCLDADDTSCIIGGAATRAYPAHAWGVCRMHYGFEYGQYVQVNKKRMYCPPAGVVAIGAKGQAKAQAKSKAVVAFSSAMCSNGVRSLGGYGSVCCPRSCGSCDGLGCSQRPGGQTNCCGNSIWRLGKACAASNDGGPCIIGGQWSQAFSAGTWGIKAVHRGGGGGGTDSKALVVAGSTPVTPVAAAPDPKVIAQAKCQRGVRSETGDKIACCPASCGTCDGFGCSSRPGGPRHCCGLAIWKGGRQCLGPEDTMCIIGWEASKGFAPNMWGLCKGYYSYPHGQYVQVRNRKFYCPGAGNK